MNRQRDERGSVALEAVLILPVLILTIMTVVQVALFAHAAHLADTAAREGNRTLRLSGTAEAGKKQASEFLHRHGAQLVLDPIIAAEARDGVGSVEVAGHVAGVIPGFSFSVRGFSSGPLEGFDAVGATP